MKQLFARSRFIVMLLLFAAGSTAAAAASQTDIPAPPSSGSFAANVTVLPNGNIVVTDPTYDAPGPVADVGAVYLYSGATGLPISTLTGTAPGDNVGGSGVTVLANGDFVVKSPLWDNGSAVDAGAATWCRQTTGCPNTVTAANSLVGSTASDQVGLQLTGLPNGSYLVISQSWDNGAAADAGAVTWCRADGSAVGPVSAANSLVGASSFDNVGGFVIILSNGNYVIQNPNWDNGAAANAGAVVWGDGANGTSGVVSAANALVGSTADDQLGVVFPLANGNYAVAAVNWDNGATANVGAVTLCSGATGCAGPVSPANSLIGSTADDQIGIDGVVALSNGNYVVGSSHWDNGAVFNAGAATWCSGLTGCAGATVSAANSLVGASPGDAVAANNGTFALANGNYVVRSMVWDNGGVINAGAVTWGNGATGTVGPITAANSLVGSSIDDNLGGLNNGGITVLTNGNYVVNSPNWDNGPRLNVGASTWGSGLGGTVGAVSSVNSLIGLLAQDQIGSAGAVPLTNGNYVVRSQAFNSGIGAATWGSGLGGSTGFVSIANSLIGGAAGDGVGTNVTALPNGNYVVASPLWNNAGLTDAGAVTLGNGVSGTTGFVGAANSLIGTALNERAGLSGVTVLTNGNFVVGNSGWDNGAAIDAGSVTWCSGTGGCPPAVSAATSLVGTKSNDNLGTAFTVTALPNGNYAVRSPNFDNGPLANSGAVTYGAGNGGTVGPVTNSNSVLGSAAGGGPIQVFGFDPADETLVVGRRAEGLVTIFNPTYTAVANGGWSTAPTWDYGTFAKPHDVVVPNGRSVSLDGIRTVKTLLIDCGGALNGGGPAAYVVGPTQKNFCATGSFTYPVGSANGYSPVDVAVTALGVSPSALTIVPSQKTHPNLFPGSSLKRYWTLTETGDLAADLTFHYLDPLDIAGSEASYKLYRIEGVLGPRLYPSTLDPGLNTITAAGVTDFSDWAVGNLTPTSAAAALAGRVTDARGTALRGVTIRLTDGRGVSRTCLTNSFGRYRFGELRAGEVYIVAVASKRFVFEPSVRVVTAGAELGEVDFSAGEQ
ncbi:MAG: carboxypeptidase regulatory-like domain-containing protein [Acidobacteria bacterium]|nr:carboxypeptidase regulatory-like domain-containing protein [Acidobacteriota bacterium]